MDDVIAETPRTVLRPWRLDEADRFFDMHRRDEVARWIGGRAMTDPAEASAALLAYGFGLGLPEIWAVTHLHNVRSARVCEKLGLGLLGVTRRWYHQPLLMFWAAASAAQQPSLRPDAEAP